MSNDTQRVCEQCGASFTPKQARQRYCSALCQDRARRERDKANPNAACAVCGQPYHASSRDHFTCSYACRAVRRMFIQGGAPRTEWRCERLHGQYSMLPAGYFDQPRTCKRCGAEVDWKKQYCEPCRVEVAKSRKHQERPRGGGNDRARARRAGADYQYINRKKVYERDQWRCHICGRLTDKKAYSARRWDNYTPNPRYPTLDHLVPIAHGGAHTYANVACACWECNVNKGTDAVGEQLLLIG